MAQSFKTVVLLAALVMARGGVLAKENEVALKLPSIETALLEPLELANISIWVPAVKSGPLINRACQGKSNYSYFAVLGANVQHVKTDACPEEVARLLAEYTAVYHEESLPLTIFNGWQWEYSFGICQFESVSYDLDARGGCWENSWEAVLTHSEGTISLKWLKTSYSGDSPGEPVNNKQTSIIEVNTFSSMRTRDGYPKRRQLQ